MASDPSAESAAGHASKRLVDPSASAIVEVAGPSHGPQFTEPWPSNVRLSGEQLLSMARVWSPSSSETEQTSVRVPTVLRDAIRALNEAGAAITFSEVLIDGARNVVEAIVHRAGLEEHYLEHPELRPSVARVAVALADLDGSPLAEHPELIERAERELVESGRSPTPDELLIYADALLTHGVAG